MPLRFPPHHWFTRGHMIRTFRKPWITTTSVLFATLLLTTMLASLNSQARSSEECLTKTQARARYGTSHLFWHTDDHCWDNTRGHKRRDIAPDRPAIPDPHGNPTIVFPSVIKGSIPDLSGLFGAEPMLFYPLIFDIDDMRPRFTVWEERIEGQF